MPRIGLISDTHGYLDPRVVAHFAACDEIWHAGDFGSIDVAQQLQEITTVRGVFGNIDEEAIRQRFPLHQRFTCDQLDVWMTHIGGRPGRYDRRVARQLRETPPGLFICGHSHIVVAHRDHQHGGMLHLNPGAAGHEGSHLMRTAMRFRVSAGRVEELQLIEFGPRGRRE